jgi:Fe-S-cluster containining protein
MSDAGKPSTWRKYVNGLCKGCYAGCCTLPVELTWHDLVRMDLIQPEEAMGSYRKILKKLKGKIRSFRVKTGLYVLEQRPNGDCVFLDSNRLCMIYDKRPEVCRRFPSIGPRPGYCPQRLK